MDRNSNSDPDPSAIDAGAMAALVASLGSDDFAPQLHRFMEEGISARVLFAIEIDRQAGGRVLVTESSDSDLRAQATVASRDYAQEDFRTDPSIAGFRQGQDHGSEILVRGAADIADPAFRARYFDDMAIDQEIAVYDDSGGSLLYLGFCGAGGFEAGELAFVKGLSPLILALLRKHRQMLGEAPEASLPRPGRPDERRALIRRAMLEHPAGLTPREAEVCAAIVSGYRSEAIGLLLGISTNTVTTHRKRAYAKLGISSQTELFACFFSVVG